MAHYCRPPIGPVFGYDVDGKAGPDSIWRMQVPLGERRAIGLSGGQGLWVKSNNPAVVPNDGFDEKPFRDLRILTLFGRAPGTTLLQAGQGPGTWITVQVQVVPSSSRSGFVKPKPDPLVEGAKIDASGALVKQDVFLGERAIVALAGGDDLDIVSLDETVAGVGADVKRGPLRVFAIVGMREGSTFIEAQKRGPTPDFGTVISRLEVQVNPARPEFGAIATGAEAARRATEIMKISVNLPPMTPYSAPLIGTIQVQVGEIYGPRKRLILSADHGSIVYLEGDTLFRVRTADFAREILLNAIGEGANRARPMAEATRVVMTLVTGIFAGPAVAIAANIIVLTMMCAAHKDEIGQAMNNGPRVFGEIAAFRKACPTAWSKLIDKLKAEAPHFLYESLVETVTNPSNIAFFLGRVIRACVGKHFFDITMDMDKVVGLTLGKLVFYVVECAVLVSLLHLPEGMLEVGGKTLEEAGKSIRARFAKPDMAVPVSEQEATTIARELNGFTRPRLEGLGESVGGYQKLVEKLARALKQE